MFNLFAQIQEELDNFYTDKVHIAGTVNDEGAKYLKRKTSGLDFSQWETLNKVELFYNSKYESGLFDSEGQRKVFLNICQFRADVASKQIDLDVKDFVFVPEDTASEWGAYFLSQRFRQWSKDNYFGELINQVVMDYPKYGTSVLKKVGKKLERVPLLTLRNQQDATSLQTATFVIEEHKDFTLDDMKAMKGWNTKNLSMKFGERTTVYERYGMVPLSFYKKIKDETVEVGDDDISIDCLAITTINVVDKNKKDYTGSILFLEEVKERPYEEVHWKRQDGRWLGVGEIENQFENQIARNMTANMRKRALYWSSKKIFQSADPDIARNLVRDVKDGDVMKINPNGNITQVDMATRTIGEFQSNEDMWEKNSDQKSFSFEVATGEALPSGTPFRLGVVLSNAVNSHFALKREQLGLFFKRVINELVYPIFEADNRDEHTLALFATEEGVKTLREELIKMTVTENAKEQLFAGSFPDIQEIEAKVRQELEGRNRLFVDVPKNFYETVKSIVDLVITGEDMDITKRIETLTNLFTALQAKGDPRADKVLEKILSLTGENLEILAGAQPQAMQTMQSTGQAPQAQAQVPAMAL